MALTERGSPRGRCSSKRRLDVAGRDGWDEVSGRRRSHNGHAEGNDGGSHTIFGREGCVASIPRDDRLCMKEGLMSQSIWAAQRRQRPPLLCKGIAT